MCVTGESQDLPLFVAQGSLDSQVTHIRPTFLTVDGQLPEVQYSTECVTWESQSSPAGPVEVVG